MSLMDLPPPAYSPPSLSGPVHLVGEAQQALEPLPTYSRPSRVIPSTREGRGRRRPQNAHNSQRPRSRRVDHVVPMTITDPTQSRSSSWALLKFKSSAKSKNNIPCFHPGDEVVGSVELDLPREKSISSVTIAVCSPFLSLLILFIWIQLRGYIASLDFGFNLTVEHGYTAPAASKATIPFLDLKTTLWKPSMGDPRTAYPATNIPPPTNGRWKSVPVKEFKEKFLGSFSFPFSFTLPHEVDNESLPPNLFDPNGRMPFQIKYEIEVTFQTALFKADAT